MKKKIRMVLLGIAVVTLGLAAEGCGKPASKPAQIVEEVPYIREITVDGELKEGESTEGETIRGQYVID